MTDPTTLTAHEQATRLRAGLIGLGAMGRNHARVLNLLDGVDLIGVLDPAPGAVAPAGVPVVADIEQFIALGLDYAVVACPTGLHEEIGLRLAEAGIAVAEEIAEIPDLVKERLGQKVAK